MIKEELFEKAKAGDVSILNDPNLDKFVNEVNDTPLHYLAISGVVDIINHPSVAIIKNKLGITPLHYLAMKEKIEVLFHQSIAIVKDRFGNTPLHYFAIHGVEEVLNHPEAKTVKNNTNKTPHDLLNFKKLSMFWNKNTDSRKYSNIIRFKTCHRIGENWIYNFQDERFTDMMTGDSEDKTNKDKISTINVADL